MSTLYVDNLQPNLGSGVIVPNHPIQIVQELRVGSKDASSGTGIVNTTQSYVDVMSASITTKAANSKILCSVNIVGYNGSNSLKARGRLLRDDGNGFVDIDGDAYAWWGSGNGEMCCWVVKHLDNPSVSAGTTITYKVQAANFYGSYTQEFRYSDSGGASSNAITLMEIAQ